MQNKEREEHPSFGMIGAFRTSVAPPTALFNSDVLHGHTVVVRIAHANRQRDLHRDWIQEGNQIIEVEMSEAQWASFVSSMNTSGVPCTLKWQEGVGDIERQPFAPSLEASMQETRDAAHRAFDEIAEAFRVFEATPASPKKDRDEALHTLKWKINNAVPNVEFAGESLSEHAENVVQKARADIEAMVVQKAAQIGIEPPSQRLLGGG